MGTRSKLGERGAVLKISPETYYRENIEGKTEEEIIELIESLRQSISDLKFIMEDPDYDLALKPKSKEKREIFFSRQYLKQAKHALRKMGGHRDLSKEELRSKDFKENIYATSQVIYKIGREQGKEITHIVEFDKNLKTRVKVSTLERKAYYILNDENEPMDKEEFCHRIVELHMGGWKEKYSSKDYGLDIKGGRYWSIEFLYSNGHEPITFEGHNVLPYNFYEFRELVEVED